MISTGGKNWGKKKRKKSSGIVVASASACHNGFICFLSFICVHTLNYCICLPLTSTCHGGYSPNRTAELIAVFKKKKKFFLSCWCCQRGEQTAPALHFSTAATGLQLYAHPVRHLARTSSAPISPDRGERSKMWLTGTFVVKTDTE